jgi:Fe-S-cluster containining protein
MVDLNLVDMLTNSKAAKMTDPLSFSCIGCGRFCCTSVIDILVLPSEMVRIKSSLKKKNRKHVFMDDYPYHQPFKLEIDPFAQTSSIFINSLPDPEDGQPLCPLFCLSSRSGDVYGGCGVYENRPSTCRNYPLGKYIRAAYGLMEEKYVHMPNFCPGFHEPKTNQTIGEYLEKNKAPNMEMEFELYYKFIYPKVCELVDIGGVVVANTIGNMLFSIPVPDKDLSELDLHEYILMEYARIEIKLDHF